MSHDAFPHLDNVHPSGRITDYDYGRYDYETTLKLLHVSWTPDYRHVVNWTSEQARDGWFDIAGGNTISLGNGVAHIELDSVRVPVPLDECLRYNYVWLSVPVLTQDDPIPYEGAGGVRKVGAFIRRAEYSAVSTTTLTLDIDIWTTYLPHLSVRSLWLTRGHAPMYKTDVETYLSDPIVYCADLLTPDEGLPVDAGVTRGGDYLPLSSDVSLYVLASTIPYNRIASIPTATGATQSAPSYYDVDARYGHQVGVNGYVWAPNGRVYAGMRSPGATTSQTADQPTGLYYYGLTAAQVAAGDLATLASELPVFLSSVQAVYIVPINLVNTSGTVNVAEVALTRVSSKRDWQAVGTFELDRSMFGIHERWADIAKLYTYPYSVLSIADDFGRSVQVRVEDTHGTINVVQALGAAWPMLAWDVALSNVASSAGRVSYAWRGLSPDIETVSAYGADLAATMLSYEIPTYALYLEAATESEMASWADMQTRRARAIASYQTTMRNANTALENARDSADTAKDNAYASAGTAKTNADASADTAQDNAGNDASTIKKNASVANTERDDIRDKINEVKGSATGTEGGTVHPTGTGTIKDTIQRLFDDSYLDVEYTMSASDVSLKSEAVSSIANAAVAAGTGNVAGVITAGVSGIVNIATKDALATLSMENIEGHQASAIDHTVYQLMAQKGLETSIDGYHDTATTATAKNTADNITTNAQNTHTTALANSKRSKDTAEANADRSRTTARGNASASRTVAELAAKRELELAQIDYAAEQRRAGTSPAIAHGTYSGDGTHERMRNRGVHLRVMTQPSSAMRRAGDAMLRYGYRYNGIWKMDTWCPEGHNYCYWQATEPLASGAAYANNEVVAGFEAILAEGVTVWATPDIHPEVI